MDLEFLNRRDLSARLLDRYVDYSGEGGDFLKILPFYKCYRAYVRGKVTSFKLNDPHISDEEKKEAVETAERYFQMSREYAEQLF